MSLLPLESIEAVIAWSHLESLKSWSLVCRTLRHAARHLLFTRATVCLDDGDHTEAWIASSLPAIVRKLHLSGTAVLCLDHLFPSLTTLTLNLVRTHVCDELFKPIIRHSRHTSSSPCPHLTHLTLIGSSKTVVYRVLELVSIFPQLQSIHLSGFRWNVLTKLYWIPLPPKLIHLEAQVEDVLSAAVVLLIMFDTPSLQTEFNLVVHHDQQRALDIFIDEEDVSAAEADYFFSLLRTLHSLIPAVETLTVEAPITKIGSEQDTRAYLERQGYLSHLRSLSVNGQCVINDL